MKFSTRILSLAAVPLWLAAGPLMAEENQSGQIEEVVVVAHPLSGEGLSQASKVLEGDELARKMGNNIGETLGNAPGIHSAQFGKAVGRPVIHGLGGPRVRVMEDRIDAMDVSVTSADHAVGIETFTADRIEVLKGPSTLLYGTGAIGGVVDVHSGRIPHEVPDGVIGGVETRYDNNVEGASTAVKLTGGGGRVAFHIDGAWKDGDDYDIPGNAESDQFIAAEEAEEHEHEGEEGEEEEHEDEEEVRGTLPGSEYDTNSAAFGLSYVGDWGFIGASISKLDAKYGLPGGHGHHEEEHEEGEEEHEEEEHEEEEGEGNPVLDMEQVRTDIELGIRNPFGSFTSLNVRLGINDYEHREIEPNGEVATLFDNDAWELRAELVYEGDVWDGAFGVQHSDRDFSATGEEAFVPGVETQSTGVFWVTERSFDGFELETGARLGRVEHDSETGESEEFDTFAASLGFVIPLGDALSLGVVGDYSARAPVGEELYSNGPHLVTNAFEIGDPDLDREVAANIAATLQYSSERVNGSITTYYTSFDDFIYERATGEEMDELPVFQFTQDDAQFFGVDLEVSAVVAEFSEGTLQLRGMFDYVDAELDVSGNDNPPRIPPMRYGAGAAFEWRSLYASIDYMYVDEADDVAEFELETDQYEDLRIYIGWKFNISDATAELFLTGKNLTDDEQRYHTSFIKDVAPAPGRTVEFGARVTL